MGFWEVEGKEQGARSYAPRAARPYGGRPPAAGQLDHLTISNMLLVGICRVNIKQVFAIN
jgi:hypothetical protein